MYNGIRKGYNKKMLLLLHISTDSHKMGIMGLNSRIISQKWLCGWDYLCDNTHCCDTDSDARAKVIKELVACRDGDYTIPGLTHGDIVELISYIACY